MREVYGGIINDAFESGIVDAWNFWGMTPAEILGRIRAHRAARDAAQVRDDMMAWMTGVYVGKAVNNPKKFPKKPDIVRIEKSAPPKRAVEMDDTGMQTMLTAFAEVHNAIEGARK